MTRLLLTMLLLTLLLLVLALPSWAAITEVASQRATATECLAVDTCAKAFPSNVASGNLIVVGGSAVDAPVSSSVVVTDTVGTSYTTLLCTPTSEGDAIPFLAYGLAAGSGANTVTVNPSGASADQIIFAIDEFTGVHATPLDVNGGSSTGTSTTPSDGITTVTANDLLIGLMASETSQTLTSGGSYTQIGEDQSSFDGFNFEFRLVTTATAYTVDWTTSGSNPWVACTAAFKEAGGAATRRPVDPMMFP